MQSTESVSRVLVGISLGYPCRPTHIPTPNAASIHVHGYEPVPTCTCSPRVRDEMRYLTRYLRYSYPAARQRSPQVPARLLSSDRCPPPVSAASARRPTPCLSTLASALLVLSDKRDSWCWGTNNPRIASSGTHTLQFHDISAYSSRIDDSSYFHVAMRRNLPQYMYNASTCTRGPLVLVLMLCPLSAAKPAPAVAD